MKTFYFSRRRKAIGILFLVGSVFQQSLPAQVLPLLHFINFLIPIISSRSAQETLISYFKPYSWILHVAPHQAGVPQFQREVFWHQKKNFHIFDANFLLFLLKQQQRMCLYVHRVALRYLIVFHCGIFFLNHCFSFFESGE